MARNPSKPPRPPTSTEPICVGRPGGLVAGLVLWQRALKASKEGDVAAAVREATNALGSGVDLDLARSVVELIAAQAVGDPGLTDALEAMVRSACDCGLHEFGYSAANMIVNRASKTEDYSLAERYFLVAMNQGTDSRVRAAAHVNYAPIVRDGLITGIKDWRSAVALYEKAAEMGQLAGMFNAGNVSRWLAMEGVAGYADRAAKWFQLAIDRHARGDLDPTFEVSSADDTIDQCRCELAALHIDGLVSGASLDKGIDLVSGLAARGHASASSYLEVGTRNRLFSLRTQPSQYAGENWAAVLRALAWDVSGVIRSELVDLPDVGPNGSASVHVDVLSVRLRSSGEVVPLLVSHDPYLVMIEGQDVRLSVLEHAKRRYPDRFLLVGRRGLFVQNGNRIFTPMDVWAAGMVSRQSLWLGSTPEAVLRNAKNGVGLTADPHFSCTHCMISIGVNALDEGLLVADVEHPVRFVGLPGGLCMPFLNEANLDVR